MTVRFCVRVLGVCAAVVLAGVGCDDDDDLGKKDSGVKLDGPGGDAPPADAPPGSDGGAGDTADASVDLGPTTTTKLIILHTGDLHSHLQGFAPEADYTPAVTGNDTTVGGFARLAAAIGAHKMAAAAASTDVLLLDAGDFMMGTAFELLGTSEAAELTMMRAVGYDAATLGNHEFDWTPTGLAGILAAAAKRATPMLPLVASNMRFSDTMPGDDALAMFKDPGPIRTKYVKTMPSGLKVGFFGLLGKQAQSFAPSASPLTFEDPAVTAAASVADLRNNDKVDLVVALSHSGISSNGMGEDRNLAAAVPGIDVIVSGHTHDKLMTPVTVGKTLIVAAGSYGAHLGRLELEVQKAGSMVVSVRSSAYTLQAIDDTIKGDATTQAGIDAFIAGLDTVLTANGLGYKKVLARTAFDLNTAAFAESNLGDLITDAYLNVTRALDPAKPPVLAVEANGSIRADVKKGTTGDIQFADLFRVNPLGIGPDAKPGYPLVTYYLSGKDIKAGLEVAAGSLAPTLPQLADNAYFLQLAGAEADYAPAGQVFNRVRAVRLVPAGGGAPVAIDLANTTTCYKVVTSIYLAGLFSLVSTVSNNALAVEAKQEDCVTKITDIRTRIVDADPVAADVQELKAYQALIKYVTSLPPAGGTTPAVPASYMQQQNRIKFLP
jgi:5'-nucleotidase / UDP-sugar diphosphatase